jgi:hypothetical protein
LIPLSGRGGLADVADKMSRNEIMTANELRQVLWLKPAKEPKADKLINSNMPVGDTGVATPLPSPPARALVKTNGSGNDNGSAPSSNAE